jgi:hypothetical protein
MTVTTQPTIARLERLTPHDLVTYFRCPHELELAHVRRSSSGPGGTASIALAVRTPPDVVPLAQSPLRLPAVGALPFNEGRLDLFPEDLLVYEDETEAEELPMLFAPEQVRPDPRFRQHGGNLVDDELGLSGRPDLIVRRAGGALVPVEYKGTHPFRGLHATHGRGFDFVQLLAECRLVEATTGTPPPYGLLLYGDVAGRGAHEGWIPLPYGAAESAWVRSAVALVRGDPIRAPVPSEGTCSGCPPHRDGLCRYAAARYVGPEPARARFHDAPA